MENSSEERITSLSFSSLRGPASTTSGGFLQRPLQAQAISQTTETVSLTCSEPGGTSHQPPSRARRHAIAVATYSLSSC
jgi:hypothetical protein